MLFTPVCLLAQAPAGPGPRQAPPRQEVPLEAPLLSPEQTASILKQLDQLEVQISTGRSGRFSMALAKIRAAATSEAAALSLYLDCYKMENFDRRNLKTADFQVWKDGNETRHKDSDFQKGLVLQLEYLILTIQAQDIKEIKDMGPVVGALQGYLVRAIGAVESAMKHTASGAIEEKDASRAPGARGRGQGGRGGPGGGGMGLSGQLANTLRQSVRSNEFSRALQIDDYLRKQDWEYSPLEIEGIYRNVILPYYLSEKPDEVPAQYDACISAQMALSKVAMSEGEYEEFYKEQYPRLLWAKANFMLRQKINSVNAMADMLKIVRDNPNHPNAAEWLVQLRQLVNTEQPAPTAPTPAATPTPAAASTN